MDIITRKQAQEQGLTHYFTGKPCKHGHVAARYVKTRACCECAVTSAREWERRAPEEYTRRRKDAANKRCHERKRVRRSVDPQYRAELSSRDAAYTAKRRRECPEAYAAHMVRSRLRKAQMDPEVLTAEEARQVITIYALRIRLTRETGVEYHVDHRIPLSKGGRHHPDNLWVITAVENMRKGAKLPEELTA